MPFCTSCGSPASNTLCPDCIGPGTAVVAKTLNIIAYVFGGFMALETLLLCVALINESQLGPGFFNPVAFVFALVPVGLGLLVWSLCRRASVGDADSLRMLKVVIAIVGVLALFGIVAVLSPLVTILASVVAFIVLSLPSFMGPFDALAKERTSVY